MTTPRNPVQIATASDGSGYPVLVALADDGSLWVSYLDTIDGLVQQWKLLQNLPQAKS